jgi:hypothetical protein
VQIVGQVDLKAWHTSEYTPTHRAWQRSTDSLAPVPRTAG